jgi:hypothetical protein
MTLKRPKNYRALHDVPTLAFWAEVIERVNDAQVAFAKEVK